jgi:hypothetical protein
MLRKTSAAVRLYLVRAANARERASAAVDERTRQFHQAMESKWMDLAASTAVVERVDLFLQAREFRLRLPPSDLCPFCQRRTWPKAGQPSAELEEHIFQCRDCGREHTRDFNIDGP